MNKLLEIFLTSILPVIITALVTYFLTNKANAKQFKLEIDKARHQRQSESAAKAFLILQELIDAIDEVKREGKKMLVKPITLDKIEVVIKKLNNVKVLSDNIPDIGRKTGLDYELPNLSKKLKTLVEGTAQRIEESRDKNSKDVFKGLDNSLKEMDVLTKMAGDMMNDIRNAGHDYSVNK